MMAISPNQAKKLSDSQRYDIQKIEEEIDERLYRSEREFSDRRLDDEKVRRAIIEKYSYVGWDVSLVSSRNRHATLRFLEVNEDGN